MTLNVAGGSTRRGDIMKCSDVDQATNVNIGNGCGSSKGIERNPLRDHSDVLRTLLPFAAKQGYVFVGGVSKQWRTAWGERSKKSRMAVAVQSVSCLAWARDRGCRWDTTTCRRAAAGGSLEALEYARTQGCQWDEQSRAGAAGGEHLEVLKWCRANNCAWNNRTSAEVVQSQQLSLG